MNELDSYSGADSTGHGSTCPHFYKWLGTGGPWVEQQTVYWPSRKRSHKRLIVLVEPKKWRDAKHFPTLRAGCVPLPPYFQIHSSATEQLITLSWSNSESSNSCILFQSLHNTRPIPPQTEIIVVPSGCRARPRSDRALMSAIGARRHEPNKYPNWTEFLVDISSIYS